MSENEVNWWAGKGPTNPLSEVPLANQISPDKETPKEHGMSEGFFEAMDFVINHPGAEINFNADAVTSERARLYATSNHEKTMPDDKGMSKEIYLIWERNSEIPLAITTNPKRYTDEVREIN